MVAFHSMPWRIRILFYILSCYSIDCTHPVVIINATGWSFQSKNPRVRSFGRFGRENNKVSSFVRSFVLFYLFLRSHHVSNASILHCSTTTDWRIRFGPVQESPSWRVLRSFGWFGRHENNKVSLFVRSFFCSFVCFLALFFRSHVSNDSILLHCCSLLLQVEWSDPVQESPSSIGHCRTARTVCMWPSRFTTCASRTSSTFASAFLLRSLWFLKVRVWSWRVVSSSACIL